MNKINNNDIKLEIENHEYKLVNQPDFNFTSVTTFVGSFFEPFDEVKVANHLVNNVPKYFAETPTKPGPIINPEKANVIRLAIVVGIFSDVDLIACRITIGLVFPVAKPNKNAPNAIR